MLIDWMAEPFAGGAATANSYERSVIAPLRTRLAQAEVFLAGPDAVRMAAHVSLAKPSSIAATLPFVRLPFPHTWIEFANQDLRAAMAELGSPNLPPPETVAQILRSGFLMRCEGDDIVVEYVHADRLADGRRASDLAPVLCRFSVGEPVSARALPMVGATHEGAAGRVRDSLRLLSRDPVEAAAHEALRRRFTWVPHPDMQELSAHLESTIGAARVEAIRARQADEAARLFFMLGLPTLILLNCRNAVDLERVDAPEKLNRARVKKGRPPLRASTVIRAHLTAARARQASGVGGTSRAAVMSALVRGHFKVRASGVYWWSWHLRGREPAPRKTRALVP